MGYTQFSVDKIEEIIKRYNPKSILDFGAQNMYNQPELPAPYAREWYGDKGIEYTSIDINNEHGAFPIDLSKPLDPQINGENNRLTGQFDFVVDCGTTEHVGVDGKHDVEAFYNAWKTKFDLCKIGGIIYSENPKTGSWPGHGFNYHTEDFYKVLAILLESTEVDLGEHAACHNVIDGWNVFCSFNKTKKGFISLEDFKKLPYKLS